MIEQGLLNCNYSNLSLKNIHDRAYKNQPGEHKKSLFSNQARAWFLEIDPVRIVCMRAYVCVSAPKAINN